MFAKLVLPGRKILKKDRRGKGNLIYDDFWNMDDKINMVITKLMSNNALERSNVGKLALRTQPGAANTPWYFIRHGLNRDCLKWHDLYFDQFEIIPASCMQCWKVVIYTNGDPAKQYVKDLFKLRDFLITAQLPSKCGIDVRRFTPHRYAGFIYGDSVEQGLEHHKFVDEAIRETLPDAKVILKRACTEFEQKHPDSSRWLLTEYQLELEHRLEDLFDRTTVPTADTQGDFHQSQVLKTWVEYSHGIGDTTWREALINEGYEDPGEHLFPPARTYHDMTAEEIYKLLAEGENNGGSSME
jgi:hypothetical protein